MKIRILAPAAVGLFSIITTASAQAPTGAQRAWASLQALEGQQLTGCYHWKSKDCYAPDVKARLTAEAGQSLGFKTTAGTFHFRQTPAGGLEVRTPLGGDALPLAESNGSELVFRKPGSELRIRVADGVVALNYFYGAQLKRIYGFSLTSPGGQLPAFASNRPSTPQLAQSGPAGFATPQASPAASVVYHLYGFLKPTDANKYLKYPIADAVVRGPYYLTVYSCAPQVDFRVRSATVIRRDARLNGYYVTTAVAQMPDRKFNYELDAGSDATVGLPFLVVGQIGAGDVDAAYLEAEAPICEAAMPSAREQERRFGDYYRALGKTIVQGGDATDFRWLNPGLAIRTSCRTVGKDDGWEWCNQISFDVKSDRMVTQSIYQPGNTYFHSPGPTFKSDVRVASWQADIAERRASNSDRGRGFGRALLGAVAGFAGGANGGDMTSAVAGAVAGAAGGAMGMNAGDVYANSTEASVEESARQAELRSIATANLGQTADSGRSAEVTAGNSAGGSSAGGAIAGASGGTKTARAYFLNAMQLKDYNTRNPMCYSKLFTLTFPAGPDRSAEYRAIDQIMSARSDRFLTRCAQHGAPVAGGITWQVEGYTSFGVPHPDAANDIVVEAP